MAPWRRANQPSTKSLTQSTNHSANATHEPPSWSGMTQNMSGDSSSRPTVIAFAQLARNEGSSVTATAEPGCE